MACCLTARNHYHITNLPHHQFSPSPFADNGTVGLLMPKKRMATRHLIITHSKPNQMILQARNWLFSAITWLSYQRRGPMIFLRRQMLRKCTRYHLLKRVENSTNLTFLASSTNGQWMNKIVLPFALYLASALIRWHSSILDVIIPNSYTMLHGTQER